MALEEGVALEVNGLPDRLDLSGERVRDAIAAGIKIVCSTGGTARRGWATAADVLNTRSLSELLGPRS